MTRLLTAPVLYGLAAALVAALAFAGLQTHRLANARTATAVAQLALEANARNAAERHAQALADAREREQLHRQDMAATRADYHRRLDDAQAAADRDLADLRAGNLRLREHWRHCAATAGAGAPGTGAATGGADGSARLREESAARIVRTVAACEAQVIGLQDVVRGYLRALWE